MKCPRVVFICGALFILLGCQKNQAPATELLRVGHRSVSIDEFSQRLIEKSRGYDPLLLNEPDFAKKLKDSTIQELTIENLLLLWQEKSNLQISDDDIQKSIQATAAQYPDQGAFNHTVKTFQLSPRIIQKRVQASLVKERLVAQFPAQANVDFAALRKKYWAEKAGFMEQAKIRLQQIVVETEFEAGTVHKALKKGASSFGEIAKKYSIGAEAGNLGIVGWVKKGALPVFDAAFNLPVGRISKPKRSPYGFHIFKVLEKKRRRKVPLNEVKEQMREKSIQEQKAKLYTQWLEKQLQEVVIESNNLAIEKAKIVTQRTIQ